MPCISLVKPKPSIKRERVIFALILDRGDRNDNFRKDFSLRRQPAREYPSENAWSRSMCRTLSRNSRLSTGEIISSGVLHAAQSEEKRQSGTPRVLSLSILSRLSIESLTILKALPSDARFHSSLYYRRFT